MSTHRRVHAERQRHRGCRGKRRYPTRQRARFAVNHVLTARPDPRNGLLAPYWCDVCSAWHIGHGQET